MNATSDLASPMDDLFFALEDLLRRIADTDDSNLRQRRARLRAEMIALRDGLQTTAPQPPLCDIATPVPDSGREQVWGASALLIMAAAATAVLGILQVNPPIV